MKVSMRFVVAAAATAVLVGTCLLLASAQDAPKAPVVPEEAARRVKVRGDKDAVRAEKMKLLKEAQARKADRAARKAAVRAAASPPAIAVGGDYVYVVRGNWLYQFSVDGLRLVAKARIEERSIRSAEERRARRAMPAGDATDAQAAPERK